MSSSKSHSTIDLDIAIIVPARGGSKGIPGKNLISLNGKPLVDYTLEFASNLKHDTFLSSDDEAILDRAEIYNAKKIRRPHDLAMDNSSIIGCLIHASNYINSNLKKYDSIVMLQPTYPIRNLKEVRLAIKRFQSNRMETLVAINKMREDPSECIKLNQDMRNWSYIEEKPNDFCAVSSNRQEYESRNYFISGNFYITNIETLIRYKRIMHDQTEFYITNERYPVDIDCFEDLAFAEARIKSLEN